MKNEKEKEKNLQINELIETINISGKNQLTT